MPSYSSTSAGSERVTLLWAPAGFGKSYRLRIHYGKLEALGEIVLWIDGRQESKINECYDNILHFLRIHRHKRAYVFIDHIEFAVEARPYKILGLIDNFPEALFFISLRRIEKSLMARGIMNGRVKVVDVGELRLSKTELLAAIDVRAPLNDLLEITNMVGGWAGPAKLLARWLGSGGALDADGVFLNRSMVRAYVEDEILADLPAHWDEAITTLSLVETFDSSLLSSMGAPDLTVATLDHWLGGLLTAEDDGEGYRLNPLLARVLRLRFDLLSIEDHRRLRSRVADWASDRGDVLTAARLTMAAPTTGEINRYLLRAGGLRLWLTRGYDAVRAFVEIAGPLVDTEPRLKLLQCVVLLKDGAAGAADRLYEDAIAELPDDPGARRDAALVHATLLVYGCRSVTESDDEIFRQIAEEDRDPAWRTMLPTLLAVRHAQQAEFEKAAANIAEARAHAREAGIAYNLMFLDIHDAVIALARASHAAARQALDSARRRWRLRFKEDRGAETVLSALSAQLAFEQGRWSEAERHVRKSGHRLPGSEAWLDIYVAAFEPMMRLQAVRSGYGTALASIDNLCRRFRAQGLDRVADLLASMATCILGEERLRTSLDDPLAIAAAGGSVTHFASSAATWHEVEFTGLAEAYEAAGGGRHAAALNMLDALIDYADARMLRRTSLRALLLKTAVCDAAGLGEAADESFSTALRIGVDTGLGAAFKLIGGPSVERRVEKALGNGDDAARAFLSRLPSNRRSTEAISLTKRERQMLAELTQGGSDKEIGRRIGISDHAVRFHLKGLFRKLGVHDRAAAVAHDYTAKVVKTS